MQSRKCLIWDNGSGGGIQGNKFHSFECLLLSVAKRDYVFWIKILVLVWSKFWNNSHCMVSGDYTPRKVWAQAHVTAFWSKYEKNLASWKNINAFIVFQTVSCLNWQITCMYIHVIHPVLRETWMNVLLTWPLLWYQEIIAVWGLSKAINCPPNIRTWSPVNRTDI